MGDSKLWSVVRFVVAAGMILALVEVILLGYLGVELFQYLQPGR